jgi:hypothetical protein
VSDFLGRIAARAVGEAPLAQPRLPTLFEQVEPVADPVAREAMTQVELAAPAAPTSAVRPHGSSAPGEAELAPPSALGGLGGANLAHHASVPSRREEARLDPLQPSRSAVSTARSADAVVAIEPEMNAGSAKVPDIVTAAVPAVPLPAAPFLAADPARERSADAAPLVREDASTVRVHIGRLEVRANLQDAAPPPRPSPVEPRPQGLSLSDYLRGRREAG